MQTQDTLEALRTFVLKGTRLLHLGDDQEIFATGTVNSLFAMQLVMFIEKHFGIVIEDKDLDMANFSTLRSLHRFVTRKQECATMKPEAQTGVA
jgi:methoxymalonate biosynthesis acyl carrier protein